MHDLVPFAQPKKRKKHPGSTITLILICMKYLQLSCMKIFHPATLSDHFCSKNA